MQRAELWPMELVPSPMLAGQQQTTPGASIATSFFYTTSPLNVDYASAVRISAEFNNDGALASVSKLLDADEVSSTAADFRSPPDARGAPDQSPSSLLKVRPFGPMATPFSSRVKAAANNAAAPTPAAFKQQLQVEADVILTEFRQALSRNLRGLQQNNVSLDSPDMPPHAQQQANIQAFSRRGGCHAAAQPMDETPTSWWAVRQSASLVEPAVGFLSNATPQSEAASCDGGGIMCSSGLGAHDKQHDWLEAEMTYTAPVQREFLESCRPALSRQGAAIGTEGSFTEQASANRCWGGAEVQQSKEQQLHFAAAHGGHQGGLFPDQPSQAVIEATSATTIMSSRGRLGLGWRGASAGAVASSSPALAPSVDLSRLLESPSPAGGITPQQQTPASSRLQVSSVAATEKPGSYTFSSPWLRRQKGDVPTPMGVSREISFTPCSTAMSAATAEPPVASDTVPRCIVANGNGTFSEADTPVSKQALCLHSALQQLQQQYESPYIVTHGAACSTDQGTAARMIAASLPSSTGAQQLAASTPPPLERDGMGMLLLSPHALINHSMSWASWASEAELISRHLVSSGGGAAQLRSVICKSASSSPAVSAATTCSRSAHGPLQLHSMGLTPPEATAAKPAALTPEVSPDAMLSGAGEELSLYVTPSESYRQARGYGDRMLPVAESASSTASSVSSFDSSPRHHHGMYGGVPHDTTTTSGEAGAPASLVSGMAWIGASVSRAAAGWQVTHNPVFEDDDGATQTAMTPLLAPSARHSLPGTAATVHLTSSPLPEALAAYAAAGVDAASAAPVRKSISASVGLPLSPAPQQRTEATGCVGAGDVLAAGGYMQGSSPQQGIGHFGRMLGPAGVSPSFGELRRRLGLAAVADGDDEDVSSVGRGHSKTGGNWASDVLREEAAGTYSAATQFVGRRARRASADVPIAAVAHVRGTPHSAMSKLPTAAGIDMGLQDLLADLEAVQALLAGAMDSPDVTEVAVGSPAYAESSVAGVRPAATLGGMMPVSRPAAATSSANEGCAPSVCLLAADQVAATTAVSRAIRKLLKLARENSGLTRSNEQLRGELSRVQTTQLEVQARNKLLQAMLEERGNEVARLSKANLRRTVKLESQLTGCQERIRQLESMQAQLVLEGHQQVQQLEEAYGHVASISTEAASLRQEVKQYAEACAAHQERVAMLEHELAGAAAAAEQEASAAEAVEAAAAAMAAEAHEQHHNRLRLLQVLLANDELEPYQLAWTYSDWGSHAGNGAQLLPPAAECSSTVPLQQTAGGSYDRSNAGQQKQLLDSQQLQQLVCDLQHQLAGAQELHAQLQDELEAARVAMAELVAERLAARAEMARWEVAAAQSAAVAAAAQAAEVQAREGERRAQQAVGQCEAQMREVMSQLRAAQQQFAEREESLQQLLVQAEAEHEVLRRQGQQEVEGMQQQLAHAEAECDALRQQAQQELHTWEQQLAEAQANAAQLEHVVQEHKQMQLREDDDATLVTLQHELVSQLQQQLFEERQRSAVLGVEVQTATRRLLDFKQQLRAVSIANAGEPAAGPVCWDNATGTAMEDLTATATITPHSAAGSGGSPPVLEIAGALVRVHAELHDLRGRQADAEELIALQEQELKALRGEHGGSGAVIDVNVCPGSLAVTPSSSLVHEPWAGASSHAMPAMSSLLRGGCSLSMAEPVLQLRYALRQVEQTSAELAGIMCGECDAGTSDGTSAPVLPPGAVTGIESGLQEQVWVIQNLRQLTAAARRVAAWLAACLPRKTSAVIRRLQELEQQLEQERAHQREEQLETRIHLASFQRVSQQLAAKVAEYEATIARLQRQAASPSLSHS